MEYEILKTYCICEKTYSQHCTEWLNMKNFSLKIRNKPRILTFTTSINIILEVLVRAFRQEKVIKSQKQNFLCSQMTLSCMQKA